MQRWDPDAEIPDRTRCQGCGAHVAADFRRTHGDDRGLVHACTECDEMHNLAQTALGKAPSRRFGGRTE